MAIRERPSDRGARAARSISRRAGEELFNARVAAGLSLRVAARAAGMSHSQLSRLEHGELALPTVDQIARAAAVSGLRVSFRLYPEGDPIRDAGHHRLLERLRSRVHPGLWWRTEVPLGIAGDLRCWDAEIGTRAWSTKIEAEMHLGDIQAFERRLALKRRDGGDPTVIILVADTKHNSRVLRATRESLRGSYPLDTRQVLAALAAARDPGRGGIVVL